MIVVVAHAEAEEFAIGLKWAATRPLIVGTVSYKGSTRANGAMRLGLDGT